MEVIQTPLPDIELELFKELKDIKLIVDVGARVDTDYTTLIPGVILHAFEPNPMFFQALKQKLEGVPNVYLNPYGIGDMNENRPYDPSTQSFMLPVTGEPLRIRILDDYIKENNITEIDYLKVDVEGYDLRVLAGSPKAVQMSRFIQYEHWDYLEPFHYLLSKDFDMEYVGYRNVLCMNRNKVPLNERRRLTRLIHERNYQPIP